MNILHLLSQTHMTGAEAHAVTLARGQLAQGHRVWIISDTLHLSSEATYIPRPVHAARGLKRWAEMLWLRRFLRRERIDVVHAHSRAAVRLGWWASRRLPTALVSTIHGRQHPSWGKRLLDTYGERVLAVCENLRQQLLDDFRMRPARVQVLLNPVDLHGASQADGPAPDPGHWVLVTRWTGPKGKRAVELLAEVLPEFLADHTGLRVSILGQRPALESEAAAALTSLEERFPGRVAHLGFRDPLEPELLRAGLVFGGGRVALAALRLGRACLAFGEASTPGLVRLDTEPAARASNFGDIEPGSTDERLDVERVRQDLRAVLAGRGPDDAERLVMAQRLERLCDPTLLGAQVEEVYRGARLLKRHPWPIPVLMYHMVVDEPLETRHRIFVTTRTFEKHLKALRRAGRTTLTFQDLLDFKLGRRPLDEFPRRPVILTFDDGYRSTLTHAEPLLRAQGMRAVVYLLADQGVTHNVWDLGSAPQLPLLSPDERRALAHGGVFEIGSHGMAHGRITEMAEARALEELAGSRRRLEAELDVPVVSFAFPYGTVDAGSAELARRAGYAYAVNTDSGGVLLEEAPRAVFRVNVFPKDSPAQVLKKASWWYRWRFLWTRGR